MCGIFGEFSFQPRQINVEQLRPFVEMMARRGPDDEGFWNDETHCAMGFRRLSILDLSPSGHQPMISSDGRFVLVYNGELYNFKDVRQELEQKGFRFHSTGDTEVVLYALVQWGSSALSRFNGMFALAFYDRLETKLLIARDHAGIKPLYYMTTSQGIVFASQYNQILAHPWRQDLTINYGALGIYLSQGYIPAPYALLNDTYMLEPGTWLEIDADRNIRKGRFFDFPMYTESTLFGDEAIEAVDAAITNAVRRQIVSDVPIASFLSGGIDSPLVSAKMKVVGNSEAKAFTIGVDSLEHDESEDARVYAQQLGLQHRLFYCTENDALGLIDDVIDCCGEPFGDYSLFPTMLVTRMARQDVSVMLSGDGGDELFWGYSQRFSSVLASTGKFRLPHWFRIMRYGMGKVLGLQNQHWPSRMFSTIGEYHASNHTYNKYTDRIFSETRGFPEDFTLFDYNGLDQNETAQWLRWNEFTGHLTRILLKVDRASMYNSLEVRVPLLDKEVIETAMKIDWRSCLDIEERVGKLPLRRVLARHTSHQTRYKRGFSVPMADWLRGHLRPIVEEHLLNQDSLLGLPINKRMMTKVCLEHFSSKVDHGWGLWILLSLSLWKQKHFS